MPKRTDIHTILVIGSGPIVIGQACEFDYSGTQACRVLKEEGYRVVLANSNPATIMTDPEFAHRTYIEPLDADVIEAIMERERPDALLPTLGGQTALNLAMELHKRGSLKRLGVEMIGADPVAIETAENREKFKAAMTEIGMSVPESDFAYAVDEAVRIGDRIGYPIIVRPSYILGGTGTGIAHDADQLRSIAALGIQASPIGEILVEQSIAGWKEYELEVVRDRKDNCIIVCGIENFDPMGVHTGDSITVAPIQTLTDVEYQLMRDQAFACIRRIGVDTGGSNVQFAVGPNGEQVIIEMNPRVSRSSALASKATGFPIAKIAAKLAVGYTLDEIPNDITKNTPASFEPVIDYVVTKIPRWAFEKLPGAEPVLGTRMQSVGEAMAMGRTFPESLQKALRSLETGRLGLNCDPAEAAYGEDVVSLDELVRRTATGTPERIFEIGAALHRGASVERLYEVSMVDPWFLDQMALIVECRDDLDRLGFAGATRADYRRAKRLGFADAQLAYLWGVTEASVRAARVALGVIPVFKTVDTCAAEFAASTPYLYSTYEDENEVLPASKPRVVILGSGPNRIGQGIEFDYCCVHACFALHDAGYETVMVNCNPETVSTDYDTADRLYFEPLTYEDVTNVLEQEQPVAVIVSLGGQTPLKLAGLLPPELIAGTSPASIDAAEDREQWNALCIELGIAQPPGGTATTVEGAVEVAASVGYPVLVRPSYVLGGRGMRIVHTEDELRVAIADIAAIGEMGVDRPVLVDRFLEDAIEVDVDAVADGHEVLIAAVMEHVEQAGVHSGDSACAIPPQSLSALTITEIEGIVRRIAERLEVRGLINVQFAVSDRVYVIEANPRASRTVPFVAKATGVPLAKVAARVMLGATLAELRIEGLLGEPVRGHVSVKEAVLPFNRFPTVDPVLTPEMRSTGEVMGIDVTFGQAYAKSQLAAGNGLPRSGTVFVSLADRDKAAGALAARSFAEAGFSIAATTGTAGFLRAQKIPVAVEVAKVGSVGSGEGAGQPTALDLLRDGGIQLVINTPLGSGAQADGAEIRRAATAAKVPVLTTVAAARAAAAGLAQWVEGIVSVRSLQEHLGADQGRLL